MDEYLQGIEDWKHADARACAAEERLLQAEELHAQGRRPAVPQALIEEAREMRLRANRKLEAVRRSMRERIEGLV